MLKNDDFADLTGISKTNFTQPQQPAATEHQPFNESWPPMHMTDVDPIWNTHILDSQAKDKP